MRSFRAARISRIGLCLAIAAAGGFLAARLGVPLPFMLGAIAATLAAALIQAPIDPPKALVPFMRVIIGVLLGSAITPDLFARFAGLGFSLLLTPVYVAIASVIGVVYYTTIGGLGRNEAFLASLPGGLYSTMALAEDAGVESRRIMLAQTLRVALVVMALPYIVVYLADETRSDLIINTAYLRDIPVREILLLTLAGAVGWVVGLGLRIPAGQIMGPILVSAAMHLTGIVDAKPPQEIIIAAQIVLGAAIGARFVGIDLRALARAAALSVGFIALMILLTVVFAQAVDVFVGVPATTGLLGYAPGGLAEMSLVALGLNLDVGFVSTLHIARLMLVLALTPVIWHKIADQK